MQGHGTKTTPVFLLADGEASISNFSLLTIKQHSATRKHLSLYPQGDRPGLRKPQMDKHQHYSQLP